MLFLSTKRSLRCPNLEICNGKTFTFRYFEGKEFECKASNIVPGQYSDELRTALAMPHPCAPPWIVNMQRYGPPPKYPHLKVPGVNAPIPVG